MTQDLVAGTTVTFRQRVWFGDHRFAFDGSNSNNGEIRIQRSSDDNYWNGSSWVSSETWNSTSVSTADDEHFYSFTPTTSIGDNFLEVTMRVNSDPATQDGDRFFVTSKGPGASVKAGSAT